MVMEKMQFGSVLHQIEQWKKSGLTPPLRNEFIVNGLQFTWI
jgi:hypothetical protein